MKRKSLELDFEEVAIITVMILFTIFLICLCFGCSKPPTNPTGNGTMVPTQTPLVHLNYWYQISTQNTCYPVSFAYDPTGNGTTQVSSVTPGSNYVSYSVAGPVSVGSYYFQVVFPSNGTCPVTTTRIGIDVEASTQDIICSQSGDTRNGPVTLTCSGLLP